MSFFFTTWQQPSAAERIPQGKLLVITAGSSCVAVTRNSGTVSAQPLPELRCTHEEADTRLVLHAAHSASSGYSVTVKSPDTDVAVLTVAFSWMVPASLYFMTGTGNKVRLINITAISSHLGPAICDSLPGFHAFTGCDSTSAFAFQGKTSGFRLLCEDSALGASFRQAFGRLGADFGPVSADCLTILEKFVCTVYKARNCMTVNAARYQLFCAKGLLSNRLPPCQDALKKHCARANYQAAIWRNCLTACPDIPPPHDGHGK